MADITENLLQTLAAGDPIAMLLVATTGKPAGRELRAIAAELLAARARIKSLEGCLVRNMEAAIRRIPKAGAARCDPVMVALAQASQERDEARAEVEQIKADRDSLLRIIGDSFMNLHIPHSAMAFDGRNLTPHAEESARASEIYRTELDAVRADLREAMKLLRAHGQPPDWLKLEDAANWNTRYGKLLAKHKEAADG